MRSFTATELARMRAVQEAAMQDTGRVLAYSAGQDAYNNPSPTYTPGAAIACGLELVTPREVQGTGEVPVVHGHVRLPVATSLDPRDRFEVTHRYGEALGASLVFEIVGPPKRGPSGLVIDVRLVDDAATGTGN